ncbi:hypothetical protein Taro_037402 [Colocasia esculenta]|uniref:Uncharacterized protein n=1 Tax=Colocasia esculenta TaxID=4460 RepID=A0A843WCQ7_COLES|nr:hypothetical protein [Colocasia esculenta]
MGLFSIPEGCCPPNLRLNPFTDLENQTLEVPPYRFFRAALNMRVLSPRFEAQPLHGFRELSPQRLAGSPLTGPDLSLWIGSLCPKGSVPKIRGSAPSRISRIKSPKACRIAFPHGFKHQVSGN